MTSGAMDRSVPPAPGPIRTFHPPPVRRQEVAGGVPVLSAITPGLGVGAIGLLFRQGVCSEPIEAAGVLKCIAETMDTGAEGLDAREIAERFEGSGLDLRIQAGWDEFSMLMTGLSERVVGGLDTLAAIVRGPDFPSSELDRVRNELRSDLRQRSVDPRSLATDAAYRFLFEPGERISRPNIGTDSGLASLSRDRLRETHRSLFGLYRPTVLVAGDLDLGECLRELDRVFSDRILPPRDSILRECRPPSYRAGRSRLVLVHRPEAAQAEIRVGHAGQPRDTLAYDSLRVANAVLGGAFSSRLNLNLREHKGYTYGASSRFVFYRQGGPFLVSTAVGSEVAGPAVHEILTELDTIRAAPPSDAEVASARQYLAGTFPLRMRTVSGMAGALAEIAVHELPLDYFEGYQDRLLRISAEDAHQAVRPAIRPEEAVVVICGNVDLLTPSLEEAGVRSTREVTEVDRTLAPIAQPAR